MILGWTRLLKFFTYLASTFCTFASNATSMKMNPKRTKSKHKYCFQFSAKSHVWICLWIQFIFENTKLEYFNNSQLPIQSTKINWRGKCPSICQPSSKLRCFVWLKVRVVGGTLELYCWVGPVWGNQSCITHSPTLVSIFECCWSVVIQVHSSSSWDQAVKMSEILFQRQIIFTFPFSVH